MSTFYLLPPRPLLGGQFAAFLQGCFPGLRWNHGALAELLGAAAQQQPDVYVIFREDLPENAELTQTLANDFGATAGDEVIEIPSARRWQLG